MIPRTITVPASGLMSFSIGYGGEGDRLHRSDRLSLRGHSYSGDGEFSLVHNGLRHQMVWPGGFNRNGVVSWLWIRSDGGDDQLGGLFLLWDLSDWSNG